MSAPAGRARPTTSFATRPHSQPGIRVTSTNTAGRQRPSTRDVSATAVATTAMPGVLPSEETQEKMSMSVAHPGSNLTADETWLSQARNAGDHATATADIPNSAKNEAASDQVSERPDVLTP